MTRRDLLSLTDDDLAAHSTRGALRRARHDVEAGAVEVEEQPDGTVAATVGEHTVALAPGVALHDGHCTCPVLGVCRHVVAVVLAYQALHDTPDPEPWDPGTLDDATLAAAAGGGGAARARLAPPPAGRRALARARARLAAGTTWTLARGIRPWATLHDEDRTVVFSVPHAIEHARCSCSQPMPCSHALAAALAFRELPAASTAGVVETARTPGAPPPRDAHDALRRLVEHGAAGGGRTLPGELAAAAQACWRAALPSPAACLDELAELVRRHHAGDASYDPVTLAETAGEAALRLRLLELDAPWPPRAFVAGLENQPARDVGSGRLVGLGTSVRRRGRTVDVVAHLAAVGDGTPSALLSTTVDPVPPVPARSFTALAAAHVRDVPLRAYGAGQVVAQGARRSADGRISFGRSPVSVTPQAFAWSELLGPAFCDHAASVQALAATRQPASLAPRRAADAPVALALAGVRDSGFSHAAQAVVISARDRRGDTVVLRHPFLSRAAAGTEALLAALSGEERIVLTAGHVRSLDPLVLEPTAVVMEGPDEARRMLQPATDAFISAAPPTDAALRPVPATSAESAATTVTASLERARTLLGALLTTGAQRADAELAQQARALAEDLARLRSNRLHTAARRLQIALEDARAAGRGDSQPVVAAALAFAALTRLARDLS
ncbi:SWIM zinc finger family protein [Conexibacter sp. CPCC 206217]|uniref:SWIM zinc finger family protein n=1 Tax=Conexibacter sp. CPCC 206217 TaxID=3064574 RepID=UPI00271E4713|nr:SWIM zinc finger family protein [Conexibacter sp. CPCC 206217]MDO8209089.1 SWIM zinc finger family protein [Conexibacter sp. CPCC 206217]